VNQERLPPLPSMVAGLRSTVCAVQRWVTIPLAEALETKESFRAVLCEISRCSLIAELSFGCGPAPEQQKLIVTYREADRFTPMTP
jgi:hypothetical protein